MKSIFCNNRTAEEKLAATKRFIKVLVACIIMSAGIVLYEVITMAMGNRMGFTNMGQFCSTLGALTAALSINLERKKELETEIESADEANK